VLVTVASLRAAATVAFVYRFLLSRRWLGFAVLVVVLATACVQLSKWQFHRLDSRREQNALIERNVAAPRTDVTDVLRIGKPVPPQREWRRVTATGAFDVSHQLLVRYQSRAGRLGFDVVTPLRTSGGAALLVDRGFVAGDDATALPPIPPPPSGRVRVTGWVRADQSGDVDQLRPQSGQVRLISSKAIAATLPYPTFGGYLAMTTVRPRPADPLVGPEQPDLGNGPHFFYALQWLFFAALALGGCVFLARAEAQARRQAPVAAQRSPVRENATAG
jgi:cytochrome oxidase assembly protein ShyY1